MKKLFCTLGVVFFFGCGFGSVSEESQVIVEEEFIEVEETTALYPTLESYAQVIEFQGGRKLKEDSVETFYYQSEDRIGSLNLRQFFDNNKEKEEVLESKRKFLSTVVYLPGTKIEEPSDKLFSFVEKISNSEETLVRQARKNQVLLQKLQQKYKKNKTSMSLGELEQLIILLEIHGEYKTSNEVEAIKCDRFSESCRKIEVTISGSARDFDFELIPNLQIQILNYPEEEIFEVNKNGAYELKILARPYQLLRLRYNAVGYMPLIKEIEVGGFRPAYNAIQEIRLPKADEVQVHSHEVRKIQTDNIEYRLKPNSLIIGENKLYEGEIQVHLFDLDLFTENFQSLLKGTLKVGEGVVMGRQIRSYQFPYVVFVDASGQSLRIPQKKAITVTNTLPDSNFVYKQFHTQGQTETEFWQYWIEYSQKPFIASEAEKDFPSYWVYNQGTGIWDEAPLRVLAEGKIQSIFYTHSQ